MAYDTNGNITAAYNAATGQQTLSRSYDAFGNILNQSGPASSQLEYGFSTKPRDPATALLYYGYRYYDPATGRWLNCAPCCICFNGYCIPNPLRQLPPNTPSTGIECCGSTPVPEGWMCCGTKIYKPYDFTDTVRIKIASKVNLGIADAKADGYVSGKESKWNQCCDGEIRDLKTLIGGGLLEIKARKPWPKLSPIKFVFEGGGRGNINARLEKTCENDNWCMETNVVIFGSMGLGAGDPDLILLDFWGAR